MPGVWLRPSDKPQRRASAAGTRPPISSPICVRTRNEDLRAFDVGMGIEMDHGGDGGGRGGDGGVAWACLSRAAHAVLVVASQAAPAR